jgi:hypothetical protein
MKMVATKTWYCICPACLTVRIFTTPKEFGEVDFKCAECTPGVHEAFDTELEMCRRQIQLRQEIMSHG